jgi:hypothetical protein
MYFYTYFHRLLSIMFSVMQKLNFNVLIMSVNRSQMEVKQL